MRQEIKITATITLGVNAALSKEELLRTLNNASIKIYGNKFSDHCYEYWDSNLERIEIEEETEIYGTEDDVL
jgi:hypothetical protein